MRALVIYHGNCADGFGAAWVARKHFARYERSVPEFYPGAYGKAPPDVSGREVYIVDFSYPRAVLETMAKQAEWITIIDHHKTATEDLANIGDFLDNVSVRFDMEHSGAMLTWLYFFGLEAPPRLIQHIEDRDLWKFKLHGTREIQAALFAYPYDFSVWDELVRSVETSNGWDAMVREGTAIERKHFKDVNELLAVCKTYGTIGGYLLPVANLPYTMSSDAANLLAMDDAGAVGACYYIDRDGYAVFSLRSIAPHGIDVSEIAKRYGGGGHRHASGFRKRAFELIEFGLLP